MEWQVINPQIHNTSASLGFQAGDRYVIGPDCLESLEEIQKFLSLEDRTLRTYRRALGFSQIIKKDLLPVMIAVKDDARIIDATVKILANLTAPVECLLPMEAMAKTDAGRNTVLELNWLLVSSKQAFLDARSTRKILDHTIRLLSNGKKLSHSECEAVNDSVTLLRNVLHILDSQSPALNVSPTQNQLIWNLFSQDLDKVLIALVTNAQSEAWRSVTVQLIALLYKDQQVGTLQNLLRMWFEVSALSESSEDDNESNTSPPERNSADSESIFTSDPTSDSSDNGVVDCTIEFKEHYVQTKKSQSAPRKSQPRQNGRTKGNSEEIKKNYPVSSDCGYGTQVIQESTSTSSNDDDLPNRRVKPTHLKPCNMLQKKRPPVKGGSLSKDELKKIKLMKKNRTHAINMKAMHHHQPTDEDISHLLKEFTIDFLTKAYGQLVTDLRDQILCSTRPMDTTYFFWLITYFLKFAVQIELDLHQVSSVVSYDIVSFLTFEGVRQCEQLEMIKNQAETDLNSCQRRIFLIVHAIRELIQTVNAYKQLTNLGPEGKEYIYTLQRQIVETEGVRNLFVLLLRQFSPKIHNKEYLQEIVSANHILLLFIENSGHPHCLDILKNHLTQFASVDMMRQYGALLQHYDTNSDFVNDCVFTMMHHVAGDLDCVSALFQHTILQVFSRVLEKESQVMETTQKTLEWVSTPAHVNPDWSDLIEYVVHKFINTPREAEFAVENKNPAEPEALPPPQPDQTWTREEYDYLYWYYVQSSSCSDLVGNILGLYAENGVTNKTRIGVIQQLLKQEIISASVYAEFMEKELKTVKEVESVVVKDEIEVLKEQLLNDGKEKSLIWVQTELLEACYAKLTFGGTPSSGAIVEPIYHYSTILDEPMPIVPWSWDQVESMRNQIFLLLLHKLGLHLPARTGKVFARIPRQWSASEIFEIATKLGPLQQERIKFNVDDLFGANNL